MSVGVMAWVKVDLDWERRERRVPSQEMQFAVKTIAGFLGPGRMTLGAH